MIGLETYCIIEFIISSLIIIIHRSDNILNLIRIKGTGSHYETNNFNFGWLYKYYIKYFIYTLFYSRLASNSFYTKHILCMFRKMYSKYSYEFIEYI